MSNRLKVIIGFLTYLFLCSYFFGVLFSGNHNGLLMGSSLLALALAQGVALYLLMLVKGTE